MKGFVSLALFCLASVFGSAGTSAQEFSPREYRREIENPTQVMVLGTAHLSNAPEGWDPKVLNLLLDRLASFNPDVIAIENQPGPTTSKLWAYRSVYPEVAASFAGRALLMAEVAGLSLDMDMPQAEAALRLHIGKVGDNPTGAARRRSAALLAASGDPYSALVQLLRLPSSERVSGDGVSRRLAALLDDPGGERGEGVLLAARLAVRLGLERL